MFWAWVSVAHRLTKGRLTKEDRICQLLHQKLFEDVVGGGGDHQGKSFLGILDFQVATAVKYLIDFLLTIFGFLLYLLTKTNLKCPIFAYFCLIKNQRRHFAVWIPPCVIYKCNCYKRWVFSGPLYTVLYNSRQVAVTHRM